MNISPVISLPVAADISGKEHLSVKLTSTGVDLAGTGDRVIGTLLRGNNYPANGQTAVGMAADVLLSQGNGVHDITIGNNTAVVIGDELIQTAAGTYAKRSSLAVTTTDAGDLFTATAHGLANGTPIVFSSITTTTGFSVGVTYFVVTTAANTFQIAATPGGTAIVIGTGDGSAVANQPAMALATQSCPATSSGGQIQAIMLPAPAPAAPGTSVSVTGTGSTVLQTSPTITTPAVVTPVITTGLTASGSAANDYSGSTGTFKTSTGLNTIGGLTAFKAVGTPVAAAGSSNSDAGALASATIQVVSSDSAAKGVILPTGATGTLIFIINSSSTACEVYPAAGGSVNGQTTTTGSETIPASKGVICLATAADTWTVFDLAAKSS